MATWELELQEAMRVFGFCKEGCVCLKEKGVGLEPKKPVLGSARGTESQGRVVSINRSGTSEPSKMLATNRSPVAFVSSHASTETRLPQSRACGSGVECSPSLLKAEFHSPHCRPNQGKSLLCGAEEHLGPALELCLGRGRRIRQEDQERQGCSYLWGGLDSGPALLLHASTR